MNLFEKLLEIKTWRTDLPIKAVFIENSAKHSKGSYFIYYYDSLKHTFYINDLDNNTQRASAINLIENIITKAYKQEKDFFIDVVKKNQTKIKPKVFSIYQQKITNEVIIDKVELKLVIDYKSNIVKFKNPKWDNSLDDTLKTLGLKQ